MKIIGITGAIGCGKTTVANILKKMGYEVFDADAEVKNIYKNDNFLVILKSVFPRVFNKDGIDKKLLRRIVFSNQKELLKLEEIIEPFLQELFIKKMEESAHQQGLLFIDAVLLFEKGWNKYCDKVICVTVDFETQKQRVMKRDAISEEEFLDIYHLQMNNSKKCELSDIILDTGCDLNKLEFNVKKVLDKING